MGLFNFGRNKEKTTYIEEMRKILRDFMLQYIESHPRASDTVVPIFSKAEQVLRNSSETQIGKMLKENGVNDWDRWAAFSGAYTGGCA